jgi:transcriptional regulator NrdR family protein
MNGAEMNVIKSSGEREPFSEAKLRRSMQRAHVVPDMVDQAVLHVKSEMRDGIKTSEIYRSAFAFLRKHKRTLVAHYSLKKPSCNWGPRGILSRSSWARY